MKIGALIPVRLTSERLPGKALMDLAGKPVILRLLERVAACRFISSPEHVVVCATTDASDDPLEKVVTEAGYSVYRGETDDIIARFDGAMRAFDFDAVIQADGDDPLSATEYMDVVMARLLEDSEVDIVTVDGLPLGTATKAFTRRAMDKVIRSYRQGRNDTGFIYFFTKSGLCRHEVIQRTDPAHSLPDARLTLDYPVDLEVFQAIFEALERPDGPFGLSETVEFLKLNPEVRNRNLTVQDEYWQRTAAKTELYMDDPDGTVRKIVF
ncbi:MAG: hypothetical protein R8L07_12365 [Alphaproteobacteria bacterium]|nr:hypothetical protein [Alphaproteobacteria bacterium]